MIREKEKENIEKAGDMIADEISRGKPVHVIGTGGHSLMAAEEMFFRSGGLVLVNALLDPGVCLVNDARRSILVERTVGYGRVIFQNYGLKKDDLLMIVNAFGINALTIELAMEAKNNGLKLIAVTGIDFSRSVPEDHPARHPSKKNLYELADVVIDNHMPFGDAVLNIDGLEQKVAPVSTILNSFIINSITAVCVKKLIERGVSPPVWKSANTPGGDEHNKAMIERYGHLLKHP